MTEPKIRLVALSDPDYDDLIAEVYIDDECLMVVSQDEEFDSMDVELLTQRSGGHWEPKYDLLIDLLQKCRTRLWELRRA